MRKNLSVLKYGGSSVGDFSKIKEIAKYLKKRVDRKSKLVVVVSAMGDTTDNLLSNVDDLTNNPSDEHIASLLATGEQQSAAYLSIALKDLGVTAKPLTGYQAGIKTTDFNINSIISSIDKEHLENLLVKNDVLVVAGFQGINDDLEITTLGRGGSDTTATALASVLNCHCEIYTDVDGIFCTDPRIYTNAKKIDVISYEEMMEMSFLGAGIIETRSIKIANNYNIPLYIGRTLSNQKGTWIVSDKNLLERNVATGIAIDKEVIQVNIKYESYNSNLTKDVFSLLKESNISIDLISQTESEDQYHYSFTTKLEDKNRLTKSILILNERYPDIEVSLIEDYVKVSVIGAGMMEAPGVISDIYETIINNDMRIYQISTSGISISCLVDKDDGEDILRLLCEKFGL